MKFIKKYYIVLLLLLVASILVINYINNQKGTEIIIERKEVDDEMPTREDISTIDFEKLRDKYNNNDIKGAIRIVDENFERIVFQSEDNNYYLNHNYNGKKGIGEIYLDYRQDIDSSKIKILYGNTKSEIFKNYYDKEYYNKHRYLELETDNLIYQYEVLSIYEGNIDSNNIDINNLIDNSRIIYNNELSDIDEYLIYQAKIDKNSIYIISKRVLK